MNTNKDNGYLITFGVGAIAGGLGVLALFKLLPLAIAGCGGYLVYKGLTSKEEAKEQECQPSGQK